MSHTNLPMPDLWVRTRRVATDLMRDCRGLAAVEFAVIVPLMLLMFFGTVEFSSAIAIKRKVTMTARTASDLASQGSEISTADFATYSNIAQKIMYPYPTTPLNVTVSELYIDPSSSLGQARVQWSLGASPRTPKATVTIPSGLISLDPTTNKILPNQYLIFSEVNYAYAPPVDFLMRHGVSIPMSDVAYTRPRQTTCVIYPPPAAGTSASCPVM